MKKFTAKFLMAVVFATSFVACSGGGGGSVYYDEPDWYYNCYPVYDSWGYYLYDDCYWEYYNQGELVASELDISAEVADVETLKVQKLASKYTEEFGLSVEDATKLSQNVYDFAALEDRTESDIADFAEKMYGLNPSDVVSAVGKAQVGQNAELESLIESKAKDFNITTENAKGLLKALHGSALEANGINL